MKKLTLFFVTLLLLLSITSNAQVKRVLLEQYTGAWCGWCVDGTVIMDEIIKEYPDRVIGIKLHYGDSMQIALTSVINAELGVSSYPSGSIDRVNFGGKIPQSRGNWKTYCETQLAKTPSVDVSVTYNINEETRQLLVKVYANMLKTVYYPLRFNVVITEDSVSGKGKGWDQSNYLSGRQGYEDNPYYNQPRTIVGYQHMKVVRDYLGGAWGVQGEFETPAVQGNVYSHDFTYTIPENWKIKDLHIIGLVQVDVPSNKEILNCAYGVKGEASIQLTSKGESTGLADLGQPFEKEFKLKNISTTERIFRILANKSERTPDGWKVSIPDLTENEFTLQPDESITFTLSFEPDKTLGIGDATVIVEDMTDPKAFKGQGNITVYHAGISNIEIVPGGEKNYSINPLLKSLGYNEFFSLTPDEYELVAYKLNKKILIWNLGAITTLSAQEANKIKEAIEQKIPVFVCGNLSTRTLSTANLLTTYFGCQYNGWSTQGFGYAPWRVWLSGVDGDPISGPLGNQIEGNLIRYLLTLVKITDPLKTYSIMHFKNDGFNVIPNGNDRDTFEIKGEDAIIGVRVDNGESRAVLLSLTPFVIVNAQTRSVLIDRILKWIQGEVMEVENNETDNITLSVSPLPASDYVNFTFAADVNNPRIRIYNSTGALIDEINSLSASGTYTYQTTWLPSGVYTAVLNDGDKQITAKFTIIR